MAWMRRHTWLNGFDLPTERQQAREEGRDLTAVAGEFERLLSAGDDDREETWSADAGARVDRTPSRGLAS